MVASPRLPLDSTLWFREVKLRSAWKICDVRSTQMALTWIFAAECWSVPPALLVLYVPGILDRWTIAAMNEKVTRMQVHSLGSWHIQYTPFDWPEVTSVLTWRRYYYILPNFTIQSHNVKSRGKPGDEATCMVQMSLTWMCLILAVSSLSPPHPMISVQEMWYQVQVLIHCKGILCNRYVCNLNYNCSLLFKNACYALYV